MVRLHRSEVTEHRRSHRGKLALHPGAPVDRDSPERGAIRRGEVPQIRREERHLAQRAAPRQPEPLELRHLRRRVRRLLGPPALSSQRVTGLADLQRPQARAGPEELSHVVVADGGGAANGEARQVGGEESGDPHGAGDERARAYSPRHECRDVVFVHRDDPPRTCRARVFVEPRRPGLRPRALERGARVAAEEQRRGEHSADFLSDLGRFGRFGRFLRDFPALSRPRRREHAAPVLGRGAKHQTAESPGPVPGDHRRHDGVGGSRRADLVGRLIRSGGPRVGVRPEDYGRHAPGVVAQRAARHGEPGDGVGVDVRDYHAQRFARGALVLDGLERIRHRVSGFRDGPPDGEPRSRRVRAVPGSARRRIGV
mmetsp:Transcript_5782/g.23393  ORF Transcript_5782/g.23393 Transcript_5782/m.23393 type:complete len:370 (+) Transcript_5782:1816-2925(+)